MAGISSSSCLFNVNRIEVTFSDGVGNFRSIFATGFWVEKDGIHYFVTNAHNVEPRMKLGPNTRFQLEKLSIFLRSKIYDCWMPDTFPCEVANIHSYKKHIFADVIVLRDVSFVNQRENCAHSCFSFGDIAGQSFFEDRLCVTDLASFIGFPGRAGIPWYDDAWTLPIARTVNVASLPQKHFSNPGISTGDVMLVSGLSFSGSSGSPVISHEKGMGHNYAPEKLIGIMSGHWWNEEADDDRFRHSGLSYLSRSTAIIDLLV
jgi:hypothetical protein